MSVKKKPLVVVTRKLPDSIETRMRELFDARLNLDDTPMTAEQIAEAARSADVLVPTINDLIREDVINDPDCKLRMIANFGNGVDNIDVGSPQRPWSPVVLCSQDWQKVPAIGRMRMLESER